MNTPGLETVEAISKLAANGKAPQSARPYEWLLWYRLRDIYAQVFGGDMTREDGVKAIALAVNSYESEMTLYEENTGLWKRIEEPSVRFATEQTVEAANALYMALYGFAPGVGAAGKA